MLRSPEWIADYGAHIGGTVWLNMPEMGVEGEAEVLDIGPAQVYDVRPGLVTGTFRHTSGEVYDLKLESESKPIGVTGTHPFWSVDRQAWVSLLDLEIGETLETLEGTTVVESRVRRSSPEAVYNIEVEGDHCYRVGESGVLVHNASVPCNPCDELKIGIDASGNKSDARDWKYKTVNVLDERGPRFTETRGKHIDQDVVDYAVARLKSTSGGSSPDTAAHAWTQCVVGVKKDDAGHVIGESVGGSGKLAGGNIFPQNFSKNRGVQSTFEKDVIKPAVVAGKDVCVLIKLSYVNTTKDYPGRPTKVLYHAWIDGKKQVREFDNPFPQNAFVPVPDKPNYCSDQSS